VSSFCGAAFWVGVCAAVSNHAVFPSSLLNCDVGSV
jgi:hypothetical protein